MQSEVSQLSAMPMALCHKRRKCQSQARLIVRCAKYYKLSSGSQGMIDLEIITITLHCLAGPCISLRTPWPPYLQYRYRSEPAFHTTSGTASHICNPALG